MEIEYRVIAHRKERDFTTVWSSLDVAKIKYEMLARKFPCTIQRRVSQIQTIDSFDVEGVVNMIVHADGGGFYNGC